MKLRDNNYDIQDLPVLDLVEQFGAPLYVYDADAIERQYRRFVQSFDVDHLVVNFACKALTNVSILRLMRSLGAGIDAVSLGEIHHALRAGFEPQDIVFTPSSVSMAELSAAVALGVKITIDSVQAIRYMGENHPSIPVALRINPHIMAGGNKKISVGHIDSKFGISIHQIKEVIDTCEQAKVRVYGLHMHTGSDILDVRVFLRATDILFNTAEQFHDLEYIDFGSGFKVAYQSGDIETDINLFGDEMSRKFNEFCQKRGKKMELMFEPGKFLVSEAGHFLVSVNVVKHSPTTTFAGVNSGFNHLVRPMMYDSYHEILNISNPKGKVGFYSVVGYICETDTFAWKRQIPEVRPNDILAFKNAGAYCFSMASNYNSRLRPAEVLVYKGKAHLIRAQEEMESLFKYQLDPDLGLD